MCSIFFACLSVHRSPLLLTAQTFTCLAVGLTEILYLAYHHQSYIFDSEKVGAGFNQIGASPNPDLAQIHFSFLIVTYNVNQRSGVPCQHA